MTKIIFIVFLEVIHTKEYINRMENLKVSKAKIEDLPVVLSLFQDAIEYMNNNNIPQWDEYYPNEEVLEEDIQNNELYIVKLEEIIVSVFVINSDYDNDYKYGNWTYKGKSYVILHRLCVNVKVQNQGIGTKTLLLIEKMLKDNNTQAIRLDAFSKNPYALRMYENNNYKRVGEVNFRKGLFYLYEKIL